MKRPLVIGLSILLLALSLPLGALAADFKLVVPLPLTGKVAKFGEIMKKSFEMAAEEINASGGIKGSQIVLGFEDSTGKPETARAIVEKLIEGGQPVIVGEYTSACAKAVAAVAEERKTPYLVVASADDAITQQNSATSSGRTRSTRTTPTRSSASWAKSSSPRPSPSSMRRLPSAPPAPTPWRTMPRSWASPSS
jgi:ABC-type branched-subunit amino acid transport system substrate-binding protein